MTAAELYELVKDDPEVWGTDLSYAYPNWLDATRFPVLTEVAELALEALYARATGCGVREDQPDDGRPTFVWFDGDSVSPKRYHIRLAALVAAYRANKENKR